MQVYKRAARAWYCVIMAAIVHYRSRYRDRLSALACVSVAGEERSWPDVGRERRDELKIACHVVISKHVACSY